MTPQPKTKFNEILERINLLDGAGAESDIALRQLKREIEAVATHDRTEGFELYGILAAQSEDVEETRRCFEAARKLEPRNTSVLLNYAAALSRFGMYSDVRSQLQLAHTLDPSDLSVLDRYIGAAGLCCRFKDAMGLLQTRYQLTGSAFEPLEKEFRTIHLFLAAAGVSDDDGEEIMGYAADTLRAAKVFDVFTDNRLASDEDSQWLNVNISVRRPVEVAVELNEELAEREASSNLRASSLMSVSAIFIPVRTHVRHA